MVLHIANGTALKAYLTNKCSVHEEIIAFNESMITGESNEKIFSDTFFQMRARSLNVEYDQYVKSTVAELDKLLKKPYDKITLWFDEDMFCQINLLTLCAYLDYINYEGIVQLNIIRQDFWNYNDLLALVIKSYELNLQGYYSLYQDVMLRKTFNTKSSYRAIKEMEKGIKLYENYVSDNSEIRSAIVDMIKDNRSREFIVKEIIKKYPNYGIGDYNIELLYQKEISRQT